MNTIPEKKDFFNNLTRMDIKDAEYERVKETYKILNNSLFRKEEGYSKDSFRMYTDYYLYLDNLILAQSICTLTKNIFYYEDLNITSFIGSPGFALTYVLRKYEQPYKNEKGEIVTDEIKNVNNEEEYKFIRKGMIGGLSKVFKKVSKHNSKTFQFYFDFNSLYPTCMSIFPNVSSIIGFDENITLQEILETPDDNKIGF